MPPTPFVIGQWVRGVKFYGRTRLIEEILEGHRNWIWVLGTRRIGKTSLLKQLEHLTATGGDYFPVFWDFQGADDPEELHRGFEDALLDAEERLAEIGIDPAKLEGRDLFDSLGRLRRKLRASNRRLLLLCDEVEELIKLHQKDPTLLRKLRRALQSQEDVRSVLASSLRLWALADERGDTSPFLHGFTPPLFIERFTSEEARALIRQSHLTSESRPPIDEDVVERIRKPCDNHPYLIQLVAKRYLELGTVEEAVEQIASDQMVSYFFSVDFEMLSPVEQDIIRVIARASSANSDSIQGQLSQAASELSGSLLRLEHLGYVRRNQDGRFELVNYFFRRWFKEQQGSQVASSDLPGSRPLPSSERTTVSDGIDGALWHNRYHLGHELGSGATGVVYKAFDSVLKESIAIKVLREEYCASEEVLERFRREVLLARDIGHPNILPIYDLGDHDGQRYVAMKWIEGGTLSQLLRREGSLSIQRTLEIGAKLAAALAAAHARNVVHRDIKPQNVLVDTSGEPYISDFGLARLTSGPGVTRAGVFLGTPDYASPEQASFKPAEERSDIYSLGVVVFEMVTGRRPFESDSVHDVLQMHRSASPPDPVEIRPEIPGPLCRIILRAMAKDPDRRFRTAHNMQLALEELRRS